MRPRIGFLWARSWKVTKIKHQKWKFLMEILAYLGTFGQGTIGDKEHGDIGDTGDMGTLGTLGQGTLGIFGLLRH